MKKKYILGVIFIVTFIIILLAFIFQNYILGTFYCERNIEVLEGRISKDYCYVEFAEYTQDISICERAEAQSWKDECYVRVATAAFQTKRTTTCDKAPDQDGKYFCYAFLKHDSQLCAKIQNQERKDHCYSKHMVCENIQDQDTKIRCYSYEAYVRNNPTLCEELEDTVSKDSCYYLLAESSWNLTVCVNIENQKKKDLCYSQEFVYDG